METSLLDQVLESFSSIVGSDAAEEDEEAVMVEEERPRGISLAEAHHLMRALEALFQPSETALLANALSILEGRKLRRLVTPSGRSVHVIDASSGGGGSSSGAGSYGGLGSKRGRPGAGTGKVYFATTPSSSSPATRGATGGGGCFCSCDAYFRAVCAAARPRAAPADGGSGGLGSAPSSSSSSPPSSSSSSSPSPFSSSTSSPLSPPPWSSSCGPLLCKHLLAVFLSERVPSLFNGLRGGRDAGPDAATAYGHTVLVSEDQLNDAMASYP